MYAALPDRLQGFTLQRKRHGDMIFAIGRIDDGIDDPDAVRISHRATAPGIDVFSVALEDEHRRILALEDVETVTRIGRYSAHDAERLSCRELRKVGYELVRVVACANIRHF